MNIQFCGAALGVTGSCHLVTCGELKILLDCGQFQGSKEDEARNFEPFPFNPAELTCVILTHAHVDHCGRLPLLYKHGFKGQIYCTAATRDLAEIMLKDSAFIHEQDAEYQNKKNQRAGRPPVEPLFTADDALRTIPFLTPVLYDQMIHVADGLEICFNDAGHILGSAIVELFLTENGERSKMVFSGDLGMNDRPILADPKIIKKADYLIMESTYGNRNHTSNGESIEKLLDIVKKTIARGGNVIIPSFAVGRTQELIYQFSRSFRNRSDYSFLRSVPIYVDSPMAQSATQAFIKNAQVYDEETKEFLMKGDNPLDFRNLRFTATSQESKWLNSDPTPKVIISASGMCEAGRIKHHLKHNLWNPKSSIVFVGYQAVGTLGHSISHGDPDVSIFGEKIHVAAEIYNLEGFSGHADQNALLNWLGGFQKKPSQIFLVHGEEDSKRDLAAMIQQKLNWESTPVYAPCKIELNKQSVIPAETPERILNPEEYRQVCDKIADVTEAMKTVLKSAADALGVDAATGRLEGQNPNQLSAARVHQIQNALLQLESDSLNLGSLVTSEDRNSPQEPLQ